MKPLPTSNTVPRLSELPSRQREVITLISYGLTNQEIGDKLGISPRTVETHRETAMKRLGISRVALVTRYVVAEETRSDKTTQRVA